MGLYIFISDQDRIKMSFVEDQDVNELLKEARTHDPYLLLEQRDHIERRLFRKTIESRFAVYHESPALDGSVYQARMNFYGSGNKEVTMSYLAGIINGALSNKRNV